MHIFFAQASIESMSVEGFDVLKFNIFSVDLSLHCHDTVMISIRATLLVCLRSDHIVLPSLIDLMQ
jgi:hypothetical protein